MTMNKTIYEAEFTKWYMTNYEKLINSKNMREYPK